MGCLVALPHPPALGACTDPNGHYPLPSLERDVKGYAKLDPINW